MPFFDISLMADRLFILSISPFHFSNATPSIKYCRLSTTTAFWSNQLELKRTLYCHVLFTRMTIAHAVGFFFKFRSISAWIWAFIWSVTLAICFTTRILSLNERVSSFVNTFKSPSIFLMINLRFSFGKRPIPLSVPFFAFSLYCRGGTKDFAISSIKIAHLQFASGSACRHFCNDEISLYRCLYALSPVLIVGGMNDGHIQWICHSIVLFLHNA